MIPSMLGFYESIFFISALILIDQQGTEPPVSAAYEFNISFQEAKYSLVHSKECLSYYKKISEELGLELCPLWVMWQESRISCWHHLLESLDSTNSIYARRLHVSYLKDSLLVFRIGGVNSWTLRRMPNPVPNK